MSTPQVLFAWKGSAYFCLSFFATYNVYKVESFKNNIFKLQKKIFGRQPGKSIILGFSKLFQKYVEPLPEGFYH